MNSERTVQPTSLYDQWTRLDDKQLHKHPISIRLPVHVVARFAALTELLPNRTRSDLIIDLLKGALEEFEKNEIPVNDLPEMKGSDLPSSNFVLGMQYRKLANKHYQRMAKDMGLVTQELFPSKNKS